MLVLRTTNFQGATVRPIALRQKYSFVFIVHTKLFLKTDILHYISKLFRMKD